MRLFIPGVEEQRVCQRGLPVAAVTEYADVPDLIHLVLFSCESPLLMLSRELCAL